METVLGLSARERDELFSDAAQRLGFAPVLIGIIWGQSPFATILVVTVPR